MGKGIWVLSARPGPPLKKPRILATYCNTCPPARPPCSALAAAPLRLTRRHGFGSRALTSRMLHTAGAQSATASTCDRSPPSSSSTRGRCRLCGTSTCSRTWRLRCARRRDGASPLRARWRQSVRPTPAASRLTTRLASRRCRRWRAARSRRAASSSLSSSSASRRASWAGIASPGQPRQCSSCCCSRWRRPTWPSGALRSRGAARRSRARSGRSSSSSHTASSSPPSTRSCACCLPSSSCCCSSPGCSPLAR